MRRLIEMRLLGCLASVEASLVIWGSTARSLRVCGACERSELRESKLSGGECKLSSDQCKLFVGERRLLLDEHRLEVHSPL